MFSESQDPPLSVSDLSLHSMALSFHYPLFSSARCLCGLNSFSNQSLLGISLFQLTHLGGLCAQIREFCLISTSLALPGPGFQQDSQNLCRLFFVLFYFVFPYSVKTNAIVQKFLSILFMRQQLMGEGVVMVSMIHQKQICPKIPFVMDLFFLTFYVSRNPQEAGLHPHTYL